jgi:succinate dehydrogenase / fumarate reductase flavoprotein subunit
MAKYMQVSTLECDVLVIGAGGAGLRAALEASAHGARTAIVCKSLLGKAATGLAQGGIAAALDNAGEKDDWRNHFRDTLRHGALLGDWRMARIHAQEAPQRVLELEGFGALFDRTAQGRIAQRFSAGQRHARLAYGSDRTGLELLRALQERVLRQRIEVHMECSIRRLLVERGRLAGALGCRHDSGELVLFRCKAAILATGGAGRVWKTTSNPAESTGDGAALALEAGAELAGMEFVQFHPTGLAHPAGARGLLVPEAVRVLGGVLRNAAGRRFMFDHVPAEFARETASSEEEACAWQRGIPGARRPPELLPAYAVAKAIDTEVRAGRATAEGGVWLRLAPEASRAALSQQLPALRRQVQALCGLDIAGDAIQVRPTCHYSMGGVRVDPESAATAVPGLFAAGEAAAGLHGAARLGGNSLSELLVFGRRAGLHAAAYCRSPGVAGALSAREIEKHAHALLAPFRSRGGENPYALHDELQECMDDLMGVQRDGRELDHALRIVGDLGQRLTRVSVEGPLAYNPAWQRVLDLRAMLAFSEAAVRAALERKESRGSHVRRDYPQTYAAYSNVCMTVRRTASGLTVAHRVMEEAPDELKRLIDWDPRWLTRKYGSASGAATRAAAGSGTTG